MAGPSINWNQYPTMTAQDSRTIDPSQALPNTGINGGASTGGNAYLMPGEPGYGAPNMPGSPGWAGGVTGGLNNGSGFTPTSAQLPPAASGTQGSQDPQAFFNQLFPGTTLSPDMLAQHEAELNAQGIKIIRNAAGQPSKIQLPDGSVVDPIIGAGSGQNTKAWNVVAGPGGAPMGGSVNGSAGSVLGGLGYSFGSSMAPIGLFTPPTAEDALNSPGLQFALSEANRMGQNSAAAKGTLLNGRFQQALNASNIQNALQGYGDVYNRAANTYGINYQTQTGNQDRPFNKNLSLAELGKPA